MSAFLPNAQAAYVDRNKIVGYLLASSHPDGWSKARFFSSVGFRIEKWRELAEALKAVGVANPVKGKIECVYGTRYVVDGIMDTPSGRSARVRTVWFVGRPVGSHDQAPRLLTAYPA